MLTTNIDNEFRRLGRATSSSGAFTTCRSWRRTGTASAPSRRTRRPRSSRRRSRGWTSASRAPSSASIPPQVEALAQGPLCLPRRLSRFFPGAVLAALGLGGAPQRVARAPGRHRTHRRRGPAPALAAPPGLRAVHARRHHSEAGGKSDVPSRQEEVVRHIAPPTAGEAVVGDAAAYCALRPWMYRVCVSCSLSRHVCERCVGASFKRS
jgi:hypothetical protein